MDHKTLYLFITVMVICFIGGLISGIIKKKKGYKPKKSRLGENLLAILCGIAISKSLSETKEDE